MNQKYVLSVLVLTIVSIMTISNSDSVDATGKTGSYNFCSVFPAYPECVGWRTEAITDNHWFCSYVHLSNICKNPPDSEKQIKLRTQDYCCKYIGAELKNKEKDNVDKNTIPKQSPLPKEEAESILPLIIWTDKDHYNYRDKVIVYGKFDFTNPTISKNINEVRFAQTGEILEEKFAIDIKLNGDRVLRDIPVSPSGWFSAFFFQNNIYKYSTQNNLLEVEYIVTKEIPLGGPKTHAIYEFTTGSIAKDEGDTFDLWIDESSMPNKIRYGITVDNSERFIQLMRQDLVKTRIVTPEGFVIPEKSIFSIQELSAEYDEFSKYGYGTYEIQVTYGDNMSKKTFEYNEEK